MSDADVMVAGREAFDRLRERERATWPDWLAVAEALTIGRAAAMAAAKSNTPMGCQQYAFRHEESGSQHDFGCC